MTDDSSPPFGNQDWQLHERETLFQGFFRVDKLILRHRLYEGGWSPLLHRELLMRRPAVAILPYDPANGLIAMVEQFRVGATTGRSSPWCLELIAGIADHPEESLEQLARREAVEEAALSLGRLHPICNYMPSPGGCDERLHVFVAETDLSTAGGIHGKPDEGENIRLVILPFTETETLLNSGQVDNAASIIALQWLLMHHQRLGLPSPGPK